MGNRNDFSSATKETLAKRAGTLCSNPNCCALTFGPREETDKSINVGVAAHIEGAAPGAARYNQDQTPEERSSIDNGIWLCQSHAKLVDNDAKTYTVSFLRHWKEQAEKRARTAIENPRLGNFTFFDAQSLALIFRQTSTKYPKPQVINGHQVAPITLRPLKAPHDLKDIAVPLHFGNTVLSTGQVLYTMSYQNIGRTVDEKIYIKVSFMPAAILSIDVRKGERMKIIEGGTDMATFVSFYIPESLPGEIQTATIVASSAVAPEMSLWSKQGGQSEEVFVYDVIF